MEHTINRPRQFAWAFLLDLALLAFIVVPAALLAFYFVQRARGVTNANEGVLDLTVLYPSVLALSIPGTCGFTLAVRTMRPLRAQIAVAFALGMLPWLPFLLFAWNAPLVWPGIVAGASVGALALGLRAQRAWRQAAP